MVNIVPVFMNLVEDMYGSLISSTPTLTLNGKNLLLYITLNTFISDGPSGPVKMVYGSMMVVLKES